MTCFSCSVSCRRIGIGAVRASTCRRIGIFILYGHNSTVVRYLSSLEEPGHDSGMSGLAAGVLWCRARCESRGASDVLFGRLRLSRPASGRSPLESRGLRASVRPRPKTYAKGRAAVCSMAFP